MTPADRLLKSVHMAIDAERAWLDAMPRQTHAVHIVVKPRGDGWRVRMSVDKAEEAV